MVLRKAARGARPGFTLMEMLVVVAIIVTLAALGGYYFLQRADEAKKDVCKMQTKELTKAAETYKLDNDEFPPSLDALLQVVNGRGPWLKSADAIIDPWGRPYMYNPAGPQNNGIVPDIWAETEHGQIGNWMSARR
jgi:general secretion pathway protein G